ncbi:MAG: hypothetical protein KJZ84_15145 [Bryobacteraceae bacterium]|nr:hypothetical protein [Bryobacteraceae bacterium]
MMGRKGKRMNVNRSLLFLLAIALLLAVPTYGQLAISAKAGLINVADGEVYVDGKMVEHNPNGFTTIPKDGLLKTSEGRAEVLLTPGSFLRVSEYSSFRLLDNNTDNVSIDLLEGSALVEVTELLDENQLTFRAVNQVVRVKKNGVYLIDISPAPRVRVYDGGEAMVAINDEIYLVKSNRELVASAGGWAVNRFDPNDTDALYRWAKRRSEYIAMANLSAARSAPGRTAGMTGTMLGNWFFNPFFGTMTYVPWGANVFSPFGWAFFNPYQAYRFYANPWNYYGYGVRNPSPFRGGNTPTASSGRWSGQAPAGIGGMQRSGSSSMGSIRTGPSGGFGGASGGGYSGGGVISGGGGPAAGASSGAAAGGARGSVGGGARGGGRQ